MKKVADVMHAGVEWVAPDTGIAEIARIMREKDVGSIPVGENDRLVGMVTDRDIAIRGFGNGRSPASLTAGDIMSKPIVYCNASESIEDALHIMEDRQIRRLPVINENRRMVGMLSLGDISHCGQRDLAAEAIGALSSHHA